MIALNISDNDIMIFHRGLDKKDAPVLRLVCVGFS